jgi:hypothetical protein
MVVDVRPARQPTSSSGISTWIADTEAITRLGKILPRVSRIEGHRTLCHSNPHYLLMLPRRTVGIHEIPNRDTT